MQTSEGNLWETHARQWRRIGPPLRPCSADIDMLARLTGMAGLQRSGGGRVLLLGVTPEIAAYRWPEGSELLAVDSSLAMVRTVWPGSTSVAAAAIVGDWKTLPLADASRDLAIADGCFVVLDFPDAYRAVLSAVHKALRADGVFAIRWFLQSDIPEKTDAVLDDLLAGRIGNFHVFKWRLAMSLQRDLRTGVRLADVWDAWHAAVPDPACLGARPGWSTEVMATIDAYRDAPARYTFPTIEQARSAFAPYFDEIRVHVPGYELGERCVHFALRPRH